MSIDSELDPAGPIARSQESQASKAAPANRPSRERSNAASIVNLHALDSLRGGLALYVLAHHSRWLLWEGMAAWRATEHRPWADAFATLGAVFRGGHEAVMIFFALSGFFIHLRTAEALAGRPADNLSLVTFFRRRARRLIPPYLLALGLTVVLDMAGRSLWPTLYEARTGDPTIDVTFLRSGYEWHNVLPALLLLPVSLSRDFGTNGPLWSLAYEVVYYLLYPFWRSIRLRSGLVAFAVIPAACLALTAVPGRSWLVVVFMHWSVWLAGAFAAERVVRRPRGRSPGLAPLGIGLMSAAVLFLPVPEVVAFLARCGLGAGVVAGVARLPEGTGRRPILATLEWLGLRSYTIYICHFPFLVIASAYLFEHGGRPAEGWIAAAAVPLIVLACLPLFELCERHCLNARIRIS